jgi:hypothetical protein
MTVRLAAASRRVVSALGGRGLHPAFAGHRHHRPYRLRSLLLLLLLLLCSRVFCGEGWRVSVVSAGLAQESRGYESIEYVWRQHRRALKYSESVLSITGGKERKKEEGKGAAKH